MAFIDGKGLVGQAKVFATEREAELDSHIAAANETIKRLASAIAPGETVDHDTLVSLAVDGAEALKHLGAIQQTESKLATANETIRRLADALRNLWEIHGECCGCSGCVGAVAALALVPKEAIHE